MLSRLLRQKNIEELTDLVHQSDVNHHKSAGKELKISACEAGDLFEPQKDDPDWCHGKMKNLIQRFLQDKQVSGGVCQYQRERDERAEKFQREYNIGLNIKECWMIYSYYGEHINTKS